MSTELNFSSETLLTEYAQVSFVVGSSCVKEIQPSSESINHRQERNLFRYVFRRIIINWLKVLIRIMASVLSSCYRHHLKGCNASITRLRNCRPI